MAHRHPGSTRNRPAPQTNVDDHDAFVAKTIELGAWARQNQRTLLIFGAAVAVVVVGAVSYAGRSAERRMAAAEELENATAMLSIGQIDQGKADLARFIGRFDGTPYADEARLILAQFQLEAGEAGAALDVLRESDATVGDGIGTQIAMLEARALESFGDPAAAEALYLRIANAAEMEFQEVDALEDAARLRMARGDAAGAAELYGRLRDLAPAGTQARSLYEMRVAEAEAAQR